MKNAELIRRLQCFQLDAEVMINTEDGPEAVECVEARSYDPNDEPIIWLLTTIPPEPITAATYDHEEVPF